MAKFLYEPIKSNRMTNYERIKAMNIEEMAADRIRLAADDRGHDEYEGDFGSIAVDSYPIRDMAAHSAFLREIKWLQQAVTR